MAGALEAIDRLLNRGGDADEVLRAVVSRLGRLYPWVGLRFVEGDGLVLGPSAGELSGEPASYPVVFQGSRVAELQVEGSSGEPAEREFLERVATLISAHCLVGWDTGGLPWEDVR